MAKRKNKKSTIQDGAAPTQNEVAIEGATTVSETVDKEIVESQLSAGEANKPEELVQITELSNPDALVIEPVAEPKKKKFQTEDIERELMSIETATGMMIEGFKESWLPAIRVKARSMGIDGHATRSAWRAVFVAWGGHSILKR